MFISWQSSYFKIEKLSSFFVFVQASGLIIQFNHFDCGKPDKKEKIVSHRKHKFVPDIEG